PKEGNNPALRVLDRDRRVEEIAVSVPVLPNTVAAGETHGAGADAPADDRPPSPFALLFAPDRGMDRQARVGRARWHLVFAWLSAILLAAALAIRVDGKGSTLRKLEMM